MRIRDNELERVYDKDIQNRKFEIPEGITTIKRRAFSVCSALTSITIPKSITNIDYGAFEGCSSLSDITIPESVTSIGIGAFRGCSSLTDITIPESVTSIDGSAFDGCSSLKEIKIPQKVTNIRYGLFRGCSSLTDITIPEGVTSIGGEAFDGCSSLTDITIPEGVTTIDEYAFARCSSLKEIKIPKKVTNIRYGLFRGCSSLTDITIPEGVTTIDDFAFVGCSCLENVTIPKTVTSLGRGLFAECGLKEIIIPESVTNVDSDLFEGCYSLSNITIPENLVEFVLFGGLRGIGNLCKINVSKQEKNETENKDLKLSSADGVLYVDEISRNVKELMVFPPAKKDISYTLENGTTAIHRDAFYECNNLKELIIPDDLSIGGFEEHFFDYNNVAYDKDKKATVLRKDGYSKANKFIPVAYMEYLITEGKMEYFLDNADFRHFNSNIPDLKGLIERELLEEQLDFFKFAVCLGCFSKKKFLDKNGQETEVTVGQKASALLAQLIKTPYLKIGEYHGLFDSMPFETEVTQDFLKFITPQGKKNDNLELLISLENDYPGMFSKVMAGFEKANGYRTTLLEDGTTKTVSWEESFKKLYNDNHYIGVTEENFDIAEVYGSKGISQSFFDKGTELRRKAREKGIPEHLLGKEIGEQSILGSIEELRKKTAEELEDTKTIMDELYTKQFTFEWLNKNDPRNGILGLYVNCCASLNSEFYGKKIAESSITARDVQNLVVRDSKGEIISKGTLYVDEEHGYAVFNDFELNRRYRKHENKNGGTYKGDDKNESELSDSEKKQREERDLIFSAFQRGIKAFVEEYDLQHPNCPLQQINVGMGYNRLKRNVKEFEKATELLTVPAQYNFEDAKNVQYVLYRKDEKKEKDNTSIQENEER